MIITLPMQPIGKGRARSSSRFVNGKIETRHYTPERTAEWTSAAVLLIRSQFRGKQFTSAVKIDVEAFFERPKTGPNRKAIYHTIKPDRDNVDKAVLDALKKAGVLSDDCIAADGNLRKRWADKGSITITIEQLEEQ